MAPSTELKALIDILHETKSLSAAHKRYLEETTIQLQPKNQQQEEVQSRLQAVVDLYELADHNVVLVQEALQDVRGSLTVAAVAMRNYSRISCPQGQAFKRSLFRREPTAALLGWLRHAKLKLPAGVQNLIVRVLLVALKNDGFNILTDSLDLLVWEVPNRDRGNDEEDSSDDDDDDDDDDDEDEDEEDSEDDHKEDEDEANQRLTMAQKTLATLRRLALVVEYPEDIQRLLDLGFESAAAIAACAVEQFILGCGDAILGSAEQIHALASLINARNERLWAQARGAVDEPIAALRTVNSLQTVDSLQTTQSLQATQSMPKLHPQRAAAGEVLVDMDNVACDDCCSLLSPAAYLVDLLRMLKNTWVDPAKGAQGGSVLDRLLLRRPDLQYLELSCANTKVEIPYIDLCNELMETLVAELEEGSQPMPRASSYNCHDGDTAAELVATPRNIHWGLYDDYVGQLVTPMASLPFNLHIEATRQLLIAVGSSQGELLSTLKSPHRAASKSATALERVAAADALGLSDWEFAAITKEALRPSELAGSEQPQPPSPVQCWGFPAETTMATLGEQLALIQEQLLPRAGITFIDLVAVLQVPWLHGKLLVQNPQTPGDFSKLGKLRLLDTQGQSPSEILCDRLGAFVRLSLRLGWSAAMLDQALEACHPGYSGQITGAMLVQLAAIRQLDTLGVQRRLPLPTLLAIWQGADGNDDDKEDDVKSHGLCKLLGVPEVSGARLQTFLGDSWPTALQAPSHTLDIFTRWNAVVATGSTAEQLLSLASSSPEEHLSDPQVLSVVTKLASDMLSQPANRLLPSPFLLEQLGRLNTDVEQRVLEILISSLATQVDSIRTILKQEGRQQQQQEPKNEQPATSVPAALLTAVGGFHREFVRGLVLIRQSSLSPALLARVQQSPALRLNPSCWSLDEVERAMRMATAPVELLLWAAETSSNTSSTVEDFEKHVAAALGVAPSYARALLDLNYPQSNLASRVALLGAASIAEPHRLARQVGWFRKCGWPEEKHLPVLFGLAEPQPRLSGTEAIVTALASRPGPLAAMHEALRERRRDALVQYLLQNKIVRGCNVHDADALFEYLLLDVQMGAAMRTNRMAQAIASVQLFVQRCLLGLEPEIAANSINVDRWAWMGQYRMWEANRKVFLYPENWADPTLRDNKTPAFAELERGMMQSELTEATVTSLIKTYIFQTHDTAQLLVQSYCWDRTAEKKAYVVHLFGRTRTAPFVYYYRRMDCRVGDKTAVPRWSPWERLALDIPTLTTDEHGRGLDEPGTYLIPTMMNQQLHLFIAHISSKTRPLADPSNNMSKDGKSVEPGKAPDDYWEIKLGMSILRGTQWSPVCISHDSLSVDRLAGVDEQPGLPSVSSFHFWEDRIRVTEMVMDEENPGMTKDVYSSRLAIKVGRWVLKTGQPIAVPVGSFELKGHEIVAVKPYTPEGVEVKYTETKQTVFGRFISEPGFASDFKAGQRPFITEKKETVVMADMPAGSIPDTALRIAKWTTSLVSNHGSTGLVTEVAQCDSDRVEVWMAVRMDNNKDNDKEPAVAPTAVRMDHIVSPALVQAASVYDDIAAIYQAALQKPNAVRPNVAANVYGGFNDAPYKETATPAAIYTWELGFHAILLLMERLLAVQKFDLALRVARLVFDPSMVQPQAQNQTTATAATTACWRFAPFQDKTVTEAGSLVALLNNTKPTSGVEDTMVETVLEWRKNPFNAHAVARSRPLVYMKRVAMKYVEILIAAGDHHFRQFTAESIALAIQRYVEAAHVFGPAPARIPKSRAAAVRSYAQLSKELDDLSNARIDMEVLLPFYPGAGSSGSMSTTTGGGTPTTIIGVTPTSYFCVGINPEVVKLRTMIDDRLSKIRHSLDIHGQLRTPPSAGVPIDPLEAGRRLAVWGPSGSTTTTAPPWGGDDDGPMPNYRFVHLLQKALELCQELKSSAASYLSIRDRQDADALALLSAAHEATVHTAMLELKQGQLTEAEKTLEILEESQRGPRLRLEYFAALTGDELATKKTAAAAAADFVPIEQQLVPLSKSVARSGRLELGHMNVLEATEIEHAVWAGSFNVMASGMDAIASGLAMLPALSTQMAPWGIGVNISAPPWGQHFTLGASNARWQAQSHNEESVQAARVNRLQQQLQERRLQANIAGLELQGIQRQVEQQRQRIAMAKKDLELQRTQIAHARAVVEHLQSKWTRKELYIWLDGQMRDHLYQTYLLALQMAGRAERALRFETGGVSSSSSTTTAVTGAWDAAAGGLMAGETLYRRLKQLECAYVEHKPAGLEIRKNVSLRQVNPLALLSLRENGTASFSLPEALFDLDYPGHYQRRIKSVTVSIPCVLGPYGSLNCTLTLTSHCYRIDPSVDSGYKSSGEQDARFHVDKIPISAIAVSHGQNDSGVAMLDFHGERYMPMEGAGAISTWTIALPKKYRQFDYRSISDVVLQIQYTARDGGSALAEAATTALTTYLEGAAKISEAAGLFALLDLPNDFSMAWHAFKKQPSQAVLPRTLPLGNLPNFVPFYARQSNGSVTIDEIYVLLDQKAGGAGDSISSLKLSANGHELRLLDDTTDVRDVKLPGMKCFHSKGLTVPLLSSGLSLTFDVKKDPGALTTDELDEKRAKDVTGLIDGLTRGFILFRYKLSSGSSW
ncbi:hypothetical protein ASPZODRAFT_169681 [Penicilliopsis zonata CBS 506.65]|uniref:Uncharacterized protein n=1 Tax=Penicilliopsis zonata CBS 506.65 TaxID=1073090 RepID=A0A1L9S7J8_9EURO|nr:hypothetical protein ASPZODRAFT_169681 [Penicilliopsis zonata CBS 506.65]OJJ43114.1 hypothetical protein ASPZODRAFT_169681 [Penicilliopsis zonata CBS 506.65]